MVLKFVDILERPPHGGCQVTFAAFVEALRDGMNDRIMYYLLKELCPDALAVRPDLMNRRSLHLVRYVVIAKLEHVCSVLRAPPK